MITTSTEFEDLALNGAKWYAKADNIADEMENIRYSHVGNPDDVFTIGNTASAILEFDIINPTQSYDNLEFKAQQGIKTSKGMEYIDLGVFKVLNAILDGIKLSVKAVDKMTYLMSDKYVPQVTVPTTDIAILNDIASQVGITVDTSNLVSHNITYLTNAYSKREIIGYISALQGKNAYFTPQGTLAFKFYDAIDYTVDDDRLYFDSPTNVNSEKDFTCQYIKCDVYVNGTQTELTSGSGDMGISIINPFMTQTILNEVLAKINKLTFRPMEIEFLGDFRLQIGDVITVETNGNTYTVPIMQINHSSDGGVITNVVSIAQTESENAIEVESDFMQRFNKIIFDLVETREITDGNAQKIVEQGTQIQAVQGAITSKVWQEDIDTATGEMEEKYTSLEQNLNGFKTTVSNTYTTKTDFENSKATNSVSGNMPITITDSADGGYIGMNIYGRSSQKTRSGKNKFDEERAKTISNYVANSNIGTNWRTMTMDLLPNTEYTITRFTDNVSANGAFNLQFYLYENTTNTLFYVNNASNEPTLNKKTLTFTTGESGKIYLATLYGSDERLTNLFNNIDIQIEKGSVSTEYEQYGVSPSPEFSSEIESVGYENLLKNNAVSTTSKGVTFIVNDDKSVTLNGTASEDVIFTITPSDTWLVETLNKNTSYIMSGCPSDGGSNKYLLSCQLWTPTWDSIAVINDVGNGALIGFDRSKTIGFARITLHIVSGTTMNHTFYPMIRKADVTDTSYVPYGSKYMNVKSRNKNLINSYLTSTALAIYNTALYIDTPLKPSMTYTLSFNSNISFKIYANEHIFVDTLYGKTINVGKNSITLTTKDTIDVSQWLSPYGWHILKLAANITTAFNPTDVQWEEGNTATDYVAPQTSTLTIATENGLNSIGDVKDEVDLTRGVLIERTFTKVFDGTENSAGFGYGNTPNGVLYIDYYDNRIKKNKDNSSVTNSLCNRFVENTPNGAWLSTNNVFHVWSNNNAIRFIVPNISSLAEFKTKLTEWYAEGNPLTIVTVRNEPIEIPLTEDELAQYRALKTYNPTTVISVTDNPTVDVEYYRNSADGQGLANSTVRTETQIEQLANKISLIVKSGDNVTEIELTPEMAKVIAETISLNGDVKVNGNQIVDGSITANKINTNGLTVKNSGVDASNNPISVEIANGKVVLTGNWGTTTITSQGIYSSNYSVSNEGNARFETIEIDEYVKANDVQSLTATIEDLTVKDSLNVKNSAYGITGNMLEIIGTTDFTTTNIVPADEEIATIKSGGYYQVGKRVFVQMTLSPRTTLASNNYHELFTGFPKPLTGCAALSACLMDEPARLDAYIDRGNTTLVLNTSATLTQGLTIGITGSYICE